MSIHKKHPLYVDFIKEELRTITFLQSSPTITNAFPELYASAYAKHQYYAGVSDAILAVNKFEFNANFDVMVEKKPRKVILECVIDRDFASVSYVLSVCLRPKSPYRIGRKFHFDYAPVPSASYDKPIYHIQYGGKPSPELNRLGINIATLQPWLSSPRISTSPINLALFLDFVFLEFRTEETRKITALSEWRKHIKHNEDFLLTPYYDGVTRFLSGAKHKADKLLLRDFCYGKN